jgi:hypothetical protein
MAFKKLLPYWEILPSNEIKIDHRLNDLMIWKFAKANQYAILTFDEDFFEIQTLFLLSSQNNLAKNRKYHHKRNCRVAYKT